MSGIGIKSIDFDGANDRIVVGDIAALNFNALTQSWSGVCWCRNYSGAVDWRTLFGKYDDGAAAGWLFRMNTNETLQFDLFGTGTDALREEADSSNLLLWWPTWLMAGFSYDHTTSTIKLYLNGKELPSTTTQSDLATSTATTASFDIGGRPSSHWWQGRLHGAMIFGDVLTPAEFDWLFNGGAGRSPLDGGAPDNLIAYWPLGEGDTYPTVEDRSGGFNPYNVSVELNNGSADESCDYPSPLVIPATGQAFTMGLWFKTSYTTANQVIMSKLYNGSDYNWAILVGSSVLAACQSSGVSNWAYRRNTGFDYRDGVWRMVAMVHDGVAWTNVALYIGGQGWRPIVGSGSYAIGGPPTTGDLIVGGMRNGATLASAFHGSVVGEFMYDKALSLAELNTLYNGGTPVDHTLIGPTGNLKHWAKLGTGDALGVGNMLDSSGNAKHGTFTNGDSGDFVADDVPGVAGNDGTMTNMDAGDIVSDSPTSVNMVDPPSIIGGAYPIERELDIRTANLDELAFGLVDPPIIVEGTFPVEVELAFVGEPADETPPVVGSFDPAIGSELQIGDPVSFDVTDESGEFARVVVTCSQLGEVEVVHDGTQFRGSYAGVSSREMIAGGWRYTVARSGGWQSAPVFEVFAIDAAGNEAI